MDGAVAIEERKLEIKVVYRLLISQHLEIVLLPLLLVKGGGIKRSNSRNGKGLPAASIPAADPGVFGIWNWL